MLVLAGLLQIVFGPRLVRLSCELTMVFFRIYDTLVEIRDNGQAKAPAAAVYSSGSPQPNPSYLQP